jgi:hypothetical protein
MKEPQDLSLYNVTRNRFPRWMGEGKHLGEVDIEE